MLMLILVLRVKKLIYITSVVLGKENGRIV